MPLQATVPTRLVSVTLMAFSLTLAFGQSSDALKTLSLKSYTDDTDYFHVVGEIENDSASAIRYVLVESAFYDVKNQEVGTSVALTTPMDIGSGDKAPLDLTESSGSVPILEIANYSIRVSNQ